MNEDVIPAETERAHATHVSKWWLLLAAVLPILFFIQSRNRQISPNVTDSRVLCKTISDAVTQFYGDYNRLPVPLAATPAEDFDTDTSPAGGLIRILLGKEPDNGKQINPRKINYLEGLKNAKARTGVRVSDAEGSDKWIKGLVIQDGEFSVVDAWGGYFEIRMDTNNDGEVMNPNLDQIGDDRSKLSSRVIVCSPGKDGKWETWEDNVQSWD